MLPRPLHLLVATCLFASVPPAQTTVIFLGAGFGGDLAIQTYLEGRYGKTNVTFQTTEPVGTVKASTILGFDVAVLSSTPSSARYRNILHDSSTPIVNLEEAVADNVPAGEFSVTTGRTKETELAAHALTIRAAHPITAGFAVNQKVTITTGVAEVWWSTGVQAAGAVSVATDDDTATNLFLTYVDVGGTLLNTQKAICRRVMFGLTDNSFNFFTADGKKLFGQAVDWAADGCCAQRNNYGTGFAGTRGIPTITTSGRPVFGSTINMTVSNSLGAVTQGLLLVGQQPISVPLLGGTLLVNPLFEAYVPVPINGFTFGFSIPDLSALCGVAPKSLRYYAQFLQLDRGATWGASFTPGLRLKFGK